MLQPAKIAKRTVKNALRHLDIAVSRCSNTPQARNDRLREQIWTLNGITVVLDVGANTGQYASRMRAAGYRGRMVSFEPLPDAYADLERNSKPDPQWECRGVGLGDTSTDLTLNIAGNSQSSSFLPMLTRHSTARPQSAYLGTATVPCITLDSLRSDLLGTNDRAWLKLDVQGFEMQVLDGARASLPYVQVLECELSLVPLYDHQTLFVDMVKHIQSLGFDIVRFDNIFFDWETGHNLQVDGLFVRSSAD